MPVVYRPNHPLANENGMVERHLADPRYAKADPLVISDIEPFQTQDGAAITSRAALREYERRNGVRQVGTDYPGPERPPFWDKHLANERARGRR
jgi:hypothetical protein